MSDMLMTPQPFPSRITRVIAHFRKPLIILSWTNVNGMLINTNKTKEMAIYFGKHYSGVLMTYHHSVLIAGTLKEL